MAEIKISELSIGDWVQTVDCEARQKNCCVVEGIEKWRPDYVVVLKYEYGGIETLGRECIEPIPLTPEILEKNGWAEYSDVHNSWKLDIADNERVWIFKNSHDWTFQVMNWGLGHNHCMAKAYITSIHQLQNALRLAGVEKEIEL